MRLSLLRTTDPLVAILGLDFDVLVLTSPPTLSSLTEISHSYDLVLKTRITVMTSLELINSALKIRSLNIPSDVGYNIMNGILKKGFNMPNLTMYPYKDIDKELLGKLEVNIAELSVNRYTEYLKTYRIPLASNRNISSISITSLGISEVQDLIRMIDVCRKHYSSEVLDKHRKKAQELRQTS